MISRGLGNWVRPDAAFSSSSSRMMSLQSSTHSSQMNTLGPAISLRTSCWLLPQNEQYRILPPSLPRLGRSSLISCSVDQSCDAPWGLPGFRLQHNTAGRLAQRCGAFRNTLESVKNREVAIDVSGRLHRLVGATLEHRVDQAVVFRLGGTHEAIALHVAGDLFDGLAGVLGVDLVEPPAEVQDLPGMDFDVGGLALGAAGGLVDHDPRVRQRVALALGAGHQQQRGGAGGLPHAHGADVGLDELHGVVDGQTGRHHAARTVDVELDVLLGILRFQEQHLGDHQIGDVVVDRADQEDDAFLQQPRIDVERTLAARGLLDHDRDQIQRPGLLELLLHGILRLTDAAYPAVFCGCITSSKLRVTSVVSAWSATHSETWSSRTAVRTLSIIWGLLRYSSMTCSGSS